MTATDVDILPVLDLGTYLDGDAGAADVLAAQLDGALTTTGFFFVRNHGIDWRLVEDVYAAARRLHALPTDVLETIPMGADKGGYLRLGGGTSYASAIAGEVRKPNLNAAYFVHRGGYRRVNQYPDLDGFKACIDRYFDAVEQLAHTLLPLYALALGLARDFFEPFFGEPSATLRLSHYPVVDHAEHQWGLAPHTDSSFMTLLPANDVPGLWIRPDGHDWIEPPVLQESYLINSGDILRRWTNERYLSTAHRVMNASGTDRYAMPFFYGASDDALIEAVPTCVEPGAEPLHPPITYGEYQRWFLNRNYAGYTGVQSGAEAP